MVPGRLEDADGSSCCELICSRLGPMVEIGCMSERVARTGSQLPEIRMDIEHERLHAAAWVTVSPLDASGGQVIFHLRPGKPGDRRRRTPPEWTGRVSPSQRSDLQITTLGRFRVEGPNGPMNGEWLDQRPGQLLKYLVCERRRVLTSDQISEALWPAVGIDEGKNRLRYNVHALREKLEPDRLRRSPGRLVVARRGCYVLDTSGIWIDADEFEREAKAGLAACAEGQPAAAAAHLAGALRLYQDGFLAEEPYLDWAVEERERLQELAGRALRAQATSSLQLGRLEDASTHARRLADLEPFDTEVQKLFIEICLRRGRRSEALRRYALFRKGMQQSFGEEPDFDLCDLGRPNRPAPEMTAASGEGGCAGSRARPAACGAR